MTHSKAISVTVAILCIFVAIPVFACHHHETPHGQQNDCDGNPGDPGDPIPGLISKGEIEGAHDGDAVRAVGFVAGGTQVVSDGADASLRNWTLVNWTPDKIPQPDVRALDHIIYDLDVSADGSIVVTGEGGWNGHAGSPTLRLWNHYGEELTQTQAPIGFVYSVAISPDKLWTVASGFYGDIVVYGTDNLMLYATKATKKKRTKALEFSPDGSILASTSTAGRIQLWSFPQNCDSSPCELDLLLSLSHSGSWVFPIAFSPSLEVTEEVTEIVSGTDSGMVKVWTIEKLDDPNPSVTVQSVDSGAVYSLAWSSDGRKIVAGGNGVITVYDADTLEILFQEVDAHAGRVNDVAFSPDSCLIVSGGADGALKL